MQGRYGQLSFYFAAINHQFKTDRRIGERLERLTKSGCLVVCHVNTFNKITKPQNHKTTKQ